MLTLTFCMMWSVCYPVVHLNEINFEKQKKTCLYCSSATRNDVTVCHITWYERPAHSGRWLGWSLDVLRRSLQMSYFFLLSLFIKMYLKEKGQSLCRDWLMSQLLTGRNVVLTHSCCPDWSRMSVFLLSYNNINTLTYVGHAAFSLLLD